MSPPLAKPKQSTASLEHATSRAHAQATGHEYDELTMDALAERALRPPQGKTAIETGLDDLVRATRIRGPAETKREGSAGEIQAVLKKPGKGAPSAAPSPAKPEVPPTPKRVGVASFVVKYDKDPDAGPTKASFKIDFDARFLNDAEHTPEFAEFRQSAGHYYEIVAGPHVKRSNVPIRDDGYTRADDTRGHTKFDVDFHSNDYPGVYSGQPDGPQLSAEDDLRYSFTAEQTILDSSDGNKVIAKRGPHTVTITGKGDRAVGGIPKTLDK